MRQCDEGIEHTGNGFEIVYFSATVDSEFLQKRDLLVIPKSTKLSNRRYRLIFLIKRGF